MARAYPQAALDLARSRIDSAIADVGGRLGAGPVWTPQAERQLLERLTATDLASLFQAAGHKGDGETKCPMCQLMKRQVTLEARRLKRIMGEPDIEALAEEA